MQAKLKKGNIFLQDIILERRKDFIKLILHKDLIIKVFLTLLCMKMDIGDLRFMEREKQDLILIGGIAMSAF